jgi:hypothetical protein
LVVCEKGYVGRSPHLLAAGISIASGGCSRCTRRRATAALKPILQIGCKNASPARRQLNDGRSFAERDQTLERAARDADEPGDLVVAVDDERGLPSPRCGVTPFVARRPRRMVGQ